MKAVRGAIVASVVGLIASVIMTPVLILIGMPPSTELILMVIEGIVVAAVSDGLGEFMRQMGWRT